MDYFGYCLDDVILCEVCNKPANDIHHIETRRKKSSLKYDITNLMAICREHHLEFGDKVRYKELLQNIHNSKL
jgi:5-methylcytosine-specific restriction endonuclease McrA